MTRTILIVDDEDDIREVGQLALEPSPDWNIIAASSGGSGLEQAKTARSDAIVLDVMMPGMDGPAVLAQLRSSPLTQGIPVIFLTATVRGSQRDRLAGLDVSAVLAKPFDPMQLHAQVSRALGWTVAT